MSDVWNKADVQKWLRTCREKQEEYCEFLGRHDWIQHKPTEHELLKTKIGFALFGGVVEPDKASEIIRYNSKQTQDINNMFKLIQETKKVHRDKGNIWVSFLYVCCKTDESSFEIPVIRVPKYDVQSNVNEYIFIDTSFNVNEDIFIDSSFRVYKNWQDFLDHNKLPDCLMCFPRGGRYYKLSGQLQLDKQVSPEGRIGAKVLNTLDITASLIQFASVGVGIVSLFAPGARPLFRKMNTVANSYAAGRCIGELIDRNDHQQSIGLDNAESRNCYLGILGCGMGIVSDGAVAATVNAAQAGESIGSVSKIAITTITAASCAVNTLGIASNIATIIQKVKNGKKITGYDIFQVTSSVLFFTNSVISVYQVNMLLNNVDKTNTSFISKLLNLAKKSTASSTGIGEIVHFENVPRAVGLGCITPIRIATIQTPFPIVCKDTCTKLLEIAQLLWQKLIPLGEYRKQVAVYLKKLWYSWNEEISMVIEKICEHFGVKHWSPAIMEGCKYLAGGNSNFLTVIAKIIWTQLKKFQDDLKTSKEKNISQNKPSSTEIDVDVAGIYQDAVIEISKKFADQQQCESPDDFTRYLKFTCKFIRNEFMKQKQKYDEDLKIAREFAPNVTVEEYDRKKGIQTNHNQYFLQEVMKEFKTGNGFLKLMIAHERQKTQTAAEEANGTSLLLSEEGNFTVIAINNEEGRGTDGWFSKDQYLALAGKLTKGKANQTDVIIEQDACDAVMITGESERIINVITQKQHNEKIEGIALMLDYHSNATM